MRPKWSPTHWIIFTPETGKPETWHVMIIPDPDESGALLAVSRNDKPSAVPDWTCDAAGVWTWCGLPPPNKRPGKVAVIEVSGGHRV
ncbi:MAG: hypothetical protein H0W83_14350 [Planctomycetes bacterium]|nr:hypothetical protein [Planctomycetota bacterium]